MKPIALDLYCKAGGVTKGLQRAGFHVTGVDIEPQPNYCGDEFIQADALSLPLEFLRQFVFISASPPCQAHTVARVIHGREHPDLIPATRELLKASGVPWCIENVPGAPIRADYVLCGSQFGERRLKRHRWFEASWGSEGFQFIPPCHHDDGNIISVFGHGGHIYHGVAEWREVMGIDWMTRDELAQAIPPTFAEYIGKAALSYIRQSVAA